MKLIVILFSLFATQTFAAQLNLVGGESALIQANVSTTVSCDDGQPGNMQSATSKTCGKVDYDGNCIYFNETTITGKFCGEANVCGRSDYDGKCIYFNVEAACGDNGCTKSKTCGKTDYDGKCLYFNEGISCR